MQKHKYDGGLTKLFIEQAPLTHGFLPFCQHKPALGVAVSGVVMPKGESVFTTLHERHEDRLTPLVQL